MTTQHHYDRTMKEIDIEERVFPSDIADSEKEKIILKCKEECSKEIVNQIKEFLCYE